MATTDTSGGTYSGDPSTNPVEEVRFLIQDTEIDPQRRLFTDREVEYALAKEKTVPTKAAAFLCEKLATRYAGIGDKSGSNVQLKKNSLYWKYKDLANRLRAQSIDGSSSFVTIDTTATRDSLKNDTTLIQPSFRRGMHDNK